MERNLLLQQEVLTHFGREDTWPHVTERGVLRHAGYFYPCACYDAALTRPTSEEAAPLVHWVNLFAWEDQIIPFAVGPQPSYGQVCFATEDEAEQYAWREAETANLLWNAQQLTAFSELYPERNRWYREEIAGMIAAWEGERAVPLSRIGLDWCSHRCEASVWVWPHAGNPVWPTRPLKGVGASVDEAIEQLYAQCSQYVTAITALATDAITDAATDQENDEEVPSC